MKLQLNQDVKKTAGKEPEFPKIVYYLLSISLVLFVILTALTMCPRYEDAEDDYGSVIPGNHHIAKKVFTQQGNSTGFLRRNLPQVILMGTSGTGLNLLREVLDGHSSLKIVQKNIQYFEENKIFNKGLYWYQ